MREYLGESDTAEKPLVITDNGHWTKDQEIERLQQKMVKLQREHDEKERENKKLKAAFAKLKKTISTITGGD
jgi:peptidoglycan hydrolase CwlO-like protein